MKVTRIIYHNMFEIVSALACIFLIFVASKINNEYFPFFGGILFGLFINYLRKMIFSYETKQG